MISMINYSTCTFRAEYPYLEDLLRLECGRKAPPGKVPTELTPYPSPLRWRDWGECLAGHPDRRFAEYIVNGVRVGFRVGYSYETHSCKKTSSNMRSALDHPEVVRDYIARECAEGRLLGPFDPASLPGVQTSRFGVIPKGNSGKWRLILDLSSPEGGSVNDGINPDLCSLSYVSVDDAARAITESGRGSNLAKIDIKNAYRMVRVHPEDRLLLGMVWEDGLYVDAMLPFGLRSAPKIFTAVADALEWVIRQEGVERLFHYLDDFLIVAAPRSDQCEEDLRRLLNIFDRLRIPIAIEKLEGPAVTLTFLGIELDTQAMILRLPGGKLSDLKALVAEWLGKKFCTKTELQSLVGKLQHACKVVRPGRTFLRRMFELLKGTPKRRQFIRLNASFRSDLMWWHVFLEEWNGVSMLTDPALRETDHHLYSDASGSFGCGAWWGPSWFQYRWPVGWEHRSIAVKELLPIVMACTIWGRSWSQQSVLVHCDNQAVVDVVNAGRCKDPQLMQLLRGLFFVVAHFQVSVRAVHIAGHLNTGADALSRDNMRRFHLQAPQANRTPTPIPPAAVDLLVHSQPDWTSPLWSRRFRSCMQQV